MNEKLVPMIALLARMRGVELRPDWSDRASPLVMSGEGSLAVLCDAVGWAAPHKLAAPPRRHWWIALCSLSIGSRFTPRSRAAARMRSPAATRHSLFARPTVLPASTAAYVASRPATPRPITST